MSFFLNPGRGLEAELFLESGPLAGGGVAGVCIHGAQGGRRGHANRLADTHLCSSGPQCAPMTAQLCSKKDTKNVPKNCSNYHIVHIAGGIQRGQEERAAGAGVAPFTPNKYH